jgi:hypothetical protein
VNAPAVCGVTPFLKALSGISPVSLHYTVHFLGDLLPDGFGRFFSCGVSVSSTGRVRQICSFTATKERLNC